MHSFHHTLLPRLLIYPQNKLSGLCWGRAWLLARDLQYLMGSSKIISSTRKDISVVPIFSLLLFAVAATQDVQGRTTRRGCCPSSWQSQIILLKGWEGSGDGATNNFRRKEKKVVANYFVLVLSMWRAFRNGTGRWGLSLWSSWLGTLMSRKSCPYIGRDCCCSRLLAISASVSPHTCKGSSWATKVFSHSFKASVWYGKSQRPRQN